MAALPQKQPVTVEEYLALDRNDPENRYEYYDGEIRMMSGGTRNHSDIKGNLVSVLKGALRGLGCRTFESDARVRLSSVYYVYPDATVSCDPLDHGEGDMVYAPKVVFEVLSPTTESYDRKRKADLYRACPSIEEYVLISTVLPSVELYSRATPFWSFQSFGAGETLPLVSLGISVPVDDIYYGIEFAPPTQP